MIGLPYLPTDVPQDGGLQSLLRAAIESGPVPCVRSVGRFPNASRRCDFHFYLGRRSGKDAFDVDFFGVGLTTSDDCRAEAACAIRFHRASRVRLNWQGSFADHVRSTAEAVRETEQLGSYPQDLVSRSPQISAEQREKLRGLPDVVLAIVPDAAGGPVEPPPAQLAILIKPSEKSVELVANSACHQQTAARENRRRIRTCLGASPRELAGPAGRDFGRCPARASRATAIERPDTGRFRLSLLA